MGLFFAESKSRFRLIEVMSRVRLLLFLAYLLLVGFHTLLYFNSRRCWFTPRPNVETWAVWVYAERLPVSRCTAAGHTALGATQCDQVAPNRAC